MPSNAEAYATDREDHSLFVQLFAKEHQRIYNYIFALLPNRADAEDVFQQTSLILWEKFSAYDRGQPFFPWACGVAFFTVKNFLRVASRSRLRFNDELLQVMADEREALDESLKVYGDHLEFCLSRLS